MICGCPCGARRAPFWLKKASFSRSEILMLSGTNDTGGSAARAGPVGKGNSYKEEISEDSEGMMTE